MQRPRFIFLSTRRRSGRAADGVAWLLVSPNNRQLGRGPSVYDTYLGAREAVRRLREGWGRIVSAEWADDITGQWVWRVDLDGETAAVSSRSYLRARECSYNLARFLEAVTAAEIADGTRTVHQHGSASTEDGSLPVAATGVP